MERSHLSRRQGEAMLTAVVFVTVLSLAVIGSIAALLVRQMRSDRELLNSVVSYYAAESGAEDFALRAAYGLNYSSSYSLDVGAARAAVTVVEEGTQRRAFVRGDFQDRIRSLAANLDLTSSQARFHYGVQVGDGGLSMNNDARIVGNVYSNGDVVGGINAAVEGDVVVAGRLQPPTVQWQNFDSDDCSFGVNQSRHDAAQSFVPANSGPVQRVSLYLGKNGTPPSDITVHIKTNAADQPSIVSLASSLLPAAVVGETPNWVEVPFASPPQVTAGIKYWIVMAVNATSPTDHWICRKDSTDEYTGNTGKNSSTGGGRGNRWIVFLQKRLPFAAAARPPEVDFSWYPVGGDIPFRVFQAGENSRIEGLTIGDAESGTGRANLFVTTNIHGSVCPNQHCIVSDSPRQELPISAATIQQWRDEAFAGGTCEPPLCDNAGNYILDNGETGSLGPIYIPGSFTVQGRETALTVTGTIWISGTASFNNEAVIRLASSYGVNSGLILTDDNASVNRAEFEGSGEAGSYLMLLSAKNDPAKVVLDVNNRSSGVIYYASNGRVRLNNDAHAREVTGYGITLNNDALITYDSGLASVYFSSGPGATFDIQSWEEL